MEATRKLYSLQKARDTEQQTPNLQTESSIDNVTPVGARKSTLSTGSLDKFNRKRVFSKRLELDRTFKILSTNPATNPSEIAAQNGNSRQTAYDYFEELEATEHCAEMGATVSAEINRPNPGK
jgi:hypothetical protein